MSNTWNHELLEHSFSGNCVDCILSLKSAVEMLCNRYKMRCEEKLFEKLGYFWETRKQGKDRKNSTYYSRVPSHECISNMFLVSMERLQNSGWYWGRISQTEVTSILNSTDVGTFLLRDSSDSRYYFSLSVKLYTHILSIRVLFCQGKFMFDCFETRPGDIPKFDCVVKLVSYYVRVSEQDERRILARSKVAGETEIRLQKPIFNKVPTLKHLCRRIVNKIISEEEHYQLPTHVESFMRKYPYSI